MRSLKYTKKIIGLSIFPIAIATPIVIANSNIQVNNSKHNLTNYSQNVDTSNLVQVQNNQDKLLREISSKYDENNFYFKSWKANHLNIKTTFNVDFQENKDKINSWIQNLKNDVHYRRPSRLKSNENLETVYSKFIEAGKVKIINIDLNNLLIQDKVTVNAGGVWEQYNFIGQSIGSSGYPVTKYDYETKNFDVQFEINNNVQFISELKEFPFLVSLKPKNEIIYSKYGLISNAKSRIEYKAFNDSYDFNNEYNNFLYFKNQKLPWDKFFILKTSNIDNNGNYYYGINRPSIEFAFNLPLVNAINWYSKVPSKFIELRNSMNDILYTFNNNQYLFNEIFGSRENFFNFMNIYLQNFANFYYDEATYNNLISFLKDLNKSEPSQEIRNLIKELKSTKKDVQYKNMVIPANVKNTGMEKPQSGSNYNIKLLFNTLNINSLNFIIGQDIPNNNLWIPNQFKNIDSINLWNTYNDAILPIVLSQNIFVEYEDHFGNQYQTVVYDGSTKSFVKDAIKVGAVSGDFNTPYSTIKIKNISIGNFETKPYLGTNVEINNQNEFSEFINQSKLNSTKTINGKEYASQDGFNDPVYMKATNDGIEIKFRYIAEEKLVEESAWSDVRGDETISPFMLIPDEAFDDIVDKDLNPDSPLEDLLISDSNEEIINRASARPFIMGKSISSQDLKEAKKKYIDELNQKTLTFTKQDIKNYFLNDSFTNKYNEKSNKPWWTWTFKELVQEETNFNNGISGSLNVIQDNEKQDQWFKNFISNPNLANKTMSDFFPKYDEGIFYVIVPYKSAIDSTQVKLTEEAGFYYAGEQKDAYNMITNFNYVVELEVKNKKYTSKLNELNIASSDYKGQNLSFRKYQQLMNSLTKEWVNYFAIDNSRFKAEQIKDPNIEYIYVPSDDPFIQTTYGYIKIDYQNSIPAVNQIGNDVVYEQLPFDLNKIIGFTEFRHKYNKYIIESKEEWDKLSQFEQSKVILIDSQNNEILIGGHVIAQEQNFKVQGAPRIIIPDEYVDPSLKDNPFFGFNQKTKEYISLEDLRNKWNSYSQEELFNILFGNYNYNNQAELLKERIKQFGVTLYVRIDDQYRLYWGYYWYEDGEKLGDETFDYVQLTKIEVVRTDLIDLSKFIYGYNRDKDTIVSFSSLISNIKNIDKFAQFFNLNEFQLKNFINGIKKIEVIEQNQENGLIKIQITLNENYVLYNENDSFIITINAKELIKFELGSLSLNNFSQEIKEELSKRNNEEKIQYLNSLNLETKISLFKNQENKSIIFNSFISLFNDNQIQDIIFSLKNNDLIADIKFNDPNLVLDAKTNTTLTNFDHNLKVDLGLIDPFKQKVLPWMIGGIVTAGILLITAIAFVFYRRHRQKEQLLKSSSDTVVLTEKDLFSDNNENSSEDNNLDNNIENSL